MDSESYDWAAAKKRIFDRLGIDDNTDPWDPDTWSDKLKGVHASHYQATKQNPYFDSSSDYYEEFLPENITGGSQTPAVEATSSSTPENPLTKQFGAFKVVPITDPTGKVVGHHSIHTNEGGAIVASFGPYALSGGESPPEAENKWTNFFAKKHAQMNADNPETMQSADKSGVINPKTVTNGAMYAKLQAPTQDQGDNEPEANSQVGASQQQATIDLSDSEYKLTTPKGGYWKGIPSYTSKDSGYEVTIQSGWGGDKNTIAYSIRNPKLGITLHKHAGGTIDNADHLALVKNDINRIKQGLDSEGKSFLNKTSDGYMPKEGDTLYRLTDHGPEASVEPITFKANQWSVKAPTDELIDATGYSNISDSYGTNSARVDHSAGATVSYDKQGKESSGSDVGTIHGMYRSREQAEQVANQHASLAKEAFGFRLSEYDKPRIGTNCKFCGEPIKADSSSLTAHSPTVGGWCRDAVWAMHNAHKGSNNSFEAKANRIRARLGFTSKTDNWAPSTWSHAIVQAHSAFYKDNQNNPDFDDPANSENWKWSTPEHVGDFLAGRPQKSEHVSPVEEGNIIEEDEPKRPDYSTTDEKPEVEEAPQEIKTANNVSQQMGGAVSVTPTQTETSSETNAGTENIDDYWQSIKNDYRDGYRGGKGREATAAKKRLSKYPLFKHFDDLLKAKNALGIPSDKLGPVENGDVSDVRPGEARSAGKQFATISPEDNDEYTARATRHNEIAKALANLSGHFVGLMNKKEELPTTLAPEHDYSHLLGPVQDSSGVINLKSDLGDGPFDYNGINDSRSGKGTFGYEMTPMDAPIRPMTTAGKTSAGLGASQKRAPAKKTPAGISKFATADNNPSPSYKVKTTLTSFDPEHFTNRRKDRPQTVVLAHKKAFLMSKMNELHPLPTQEEKAGMSSAEHQSTVDQVFKTRTSWLKSSMEANVDHMLPAQNS
jgi:hypothetical protein